MRWAIQDILFLSKAVAGKIIKGEVDPTQNILKKFDVIVCTYLKLAESVMIKINLLLHSENE